MNTALEDGNYDELVDPRLERNYPTHEMARMVACAAAAIRHSARKRPKMSQVWNDFTCIYYICAEFTGTTYC